MGNHNPLSGFQTQNLEERLVPRRKDPANHRQNLEHQCCTRPQRTYSHFLKWLESNCG